MPKKLIVDGKEIELGGGGGTALQVKIILKSPESGEDRIAWIQCDKDTLMESDTLRFARYKGSTMRDNDANEHYRQSGWIIPHPSNYISFEMEYDEDKSAEDPTYDYWLVHPTGFDTISECARAIEEGDDNPNLPSYPCKMHTHCGICVMRDGKQITEYLHFETCANGGQCGVGIW